MPNACLFNYNPFSLLGLRLSFIIQDHFHSSEKIFESDFSLEEESELP